MKTVPDVVTQPCRWHKATGVQGGRRLCCGGWWSQQGCRNSPMHYIAALATAWQLVGNAPAMPFVPALAVSNFAGSTQAPGTSLLWASSSASTTPTQHQH